MAEKLRLCSATWARQKGLWRNMKVPKLCRKATAADARLAESPHRQEICRPQSGKVTKSRPPSPRLARDHGRPKSAGVLRTLSNPSPAILPIFPPGQPVTIFGMWPASPRRAGPNRKFDLGAERGQKHISLTPTWIKAWTDLPTTKQKRQGNRNSRCTLAPASGPSLLPTNMRMGTLESVEAVARPEMPGCATMLARRRARCQRGDRCRQNCVASQVPRTRFAGFGLVASPCPTDHFQNGLSLRDLCVPHTTCGKGRALVRVRHLPPKM